MADMTECFVNMMVLNTAKDAIEKGTKFAKGNEKWQVIEFGKSGYSACLMIIDGRFIVQIFCANADKFEWETVPVEGVDYGDMANEFLRTNIDKEYEIVKAQMKEAAEAES